MIIVYVNNVTKQTMSEPMLLGTTMDVIPNIDDHIWFEGQEWIVLGRVFCHSGSIVNHVNVVLRKVTDNDVSYT